LFTYGIYGSKENFLKNLLFLQVFGLLFQSCFCSSEAPTVLEKKIFKDLASFRGFSLPVRKIFRILEPCEQTLKRPNPRNIPAKN
jgi:hypothetical protein